MQFTTYNSRRRRSVLMIMFIGSLIGIIYPILTKEFSDPRAMTNGAVTGLVGGGIISIGELYLFNKPFYRIPFILIFILKTLFYTFSIVMVIVICKCTVDSIYYGEGFWEYLGGEKFRHFRTEEDFDVVILYSLLFLSIIIFTRMMSKKMGHSIFLNFMTGKYHKPIQEDRIFLFIDIKSSTTHAEQIGHLKFHEFLHEFFTDITKCIVTSKGEIYRYVGDQMAVTWILKEGIKNCRCIRTFFYIQSEIDRLQNKFLSKYGFIPRFTASYHTGSVIVGEIGEIKSQIVYSGTTIYTTHQVEKKCGELKKPMLVSDKLMGLLKIPIDYRVMKCGSLLDIKENNLELYTIEEVSV